MTLWLIIYLVWFVSVTLEYKNRFTARRFKVCRWDSFFYFVYWHHLASADPQWIRCCFDIKKIPRRNQFPRKDVVFSSCVPAYLPLAKSLLTIQMFLYMDYARCQNVKITSKFHTTVVTHFLVLTAFSCYFAAMTERQASKGISFIQ